MMHDCGEGNKIVLINGPMSMNPSSHDLRQLNNESSGGSYSQSNLHQNHHSPGLHMGKSLTAKGASSKAVAGFDQRETYDFQNTYQHNSKHKPARHYLPHRVPQNIRPLPQPLGSQLNAKRQSIPIQQTTTVKLNNHREAVAEITTAINSRTYTAVGSSTNTQFQQFQQSIGNGLESRGILRENVLRLSSQQPLSLQKQQSKQWTPPKDITIMSELLRKGTPSSTNLCNIADGPTSSIEQIVAPYPTLFVTTTPTKLHNKDAKAMTKSPVKHNSNLLLTHLELGNMALQRSQQLLLNNSSGSNYLPEMPSTTFGVTSPENAYFSSSTPKDRNDGYNIKGGQVILQANKRINQVSPLVSSAAHSHAMVNVYKNLSRTIASNNVHSAAQVDSFGRLAKNPTPVSVRNQMQNPLPSGHRKPPFKIKEQPGDSNMLRKIIGNANSSTELHSNGTITVQQQSSHWQPTDQQTSRFPQTITFSDQSQQNQSSGMPANNRLAILKKEQLSRGIMNQQYSLTQEQTYSFTTMGGQTQESNGVFSDQILVDYTADTNNKQQSPIAIYQNFQINASSHSTTRREEYELSPLQQLRPMQQEFSDPQMKSIMQSQNQHPMIMIRDGSKDSLSCYNTNFNADSATSRISTDNLGMQLIPTKGKGMLTNTLGPIVLIPSSKDTSERVRSALRDNSASNQKQQTLYSQMKVVNPPTTSLRTKQQNKRVVIGTGTSHFRHSSSTIKKALIAQAGSGPVLNSKSNALNNIIILNNLNKPQPENQTPQPVIQKPKQSNTVEKEPFNYKVTPTISYESKVPPQAPVSSTNDPSPQKTNIIHAFHNKNISNSSVGKKFSKLSHSANKGIDDYNREMQSVIEKEKALTEEIIKNSLVKQNGRLNFEALAHLNDIIESKKNIKKKFGVEGQGMVQGSCVRPVGSGETLMVIKSYQESQGDDLVQKFSNSESTTETFALPPEFTNGVLSKLGSEGTKKEIVKNKRISDYFLKTHKELGRPSSSFKKTSATIQDDESPKGREVEQKILDEYQSMLTDLNNKRHTLSQGSQGQREVVVSPKRHKRKRSMKDPKTLKSRIKIYHQEDYSRKHINDHPVNKAIQKINYIIRLIFKYQNGLSIGKDNNNFDTLRGLHPQSAGSPSLLLMQQSGSASTNIGGATCLQQHQVEEQRFVEIQRIAGKWFGLQIPIKKMETKTALREYFQSREFTVGLRAKITMVLNQALNKSNGMTELVSQIQSTQTTSGQVFQRFFVGPGNNDAIVRSVLKQRPWWQQQTCEDFDEVSFMWTQWKKQTHIDYLGGGNHHNLSVSNVYKSDREGAEPSFVATNIARVNTVEKGFKIYNRMEQNKQLTNKKGVFLNMRDYYYIIGKDPFEVLPLTFLIKPGKQTGETDFQRFQMHFNDIQHLIESNTKNRIIEIDRRIREIRQDLLRKKRIEQQQKAKLQQIDKAQSKRKVSMNGQPLPKGPTFKTKRSRIQCYNEDEEEPEESDETEDEEWMRRQEEEKKAIENDEKIKEIKVKYPDHKNIWIVKPGENTNRGNGINVCSELSEIRDLVLRSGGPTQESTFIIQKYIDNPLLIHGRKFDFRCYGVMTSVNGHLKGYFYEDAYIRTSCKEFDIEDVHNKFIHLTNDAVQKFSTDYGKYENGNKLSMGDFQKYLKATYPNQNIDIWRDIMPQIRKLVTDSYRSVYGKIDPSRLHNTFELFGYDFMIDSNFRLYLIEVNTNPCLEMSCPLLARIIPDVLDNTFRIVLDPIFPSPDVHNNRKHSMIPQEIKYTLVFDEDIDGVELKKLRDESTNGKQIAIIDEIESDQEDDLREGEDGIIVELKDKKKGESNSATTTSSSLKTKAN